jgi:hypothetical protein
MKVLGRIFLFFCARKAKIKGAKLAPQGKNA